MAKRKQFTFYWSFYDALADLPPEQAKEGLWIIVTYALTGRLPEVEMEPAIGVAFKLIRPVLDTARGKSDAIIASNKRRAKNKKEIQSDSNVGPMEVQAMPNIAQEGEKEKEVEIEKENEVEVEIENEIEKELEKESLYTDGVCVNRDTDTDRFERFWNLYPNKLGKQKAWEAWQMEKPDLDKLVVALECWKNSRQWRQDNGRFIPKAENFLKEKYVLQAPDGAVPRGASGYLGKAELEAIERLMDGTV